MTLYHYPDVLCTTHIVLICIMYINQTIAVPTTDRNQKVCIKFRSHFIQKGKFTLFFHSFISSKKKNTQISTTFFHY